jgi:DNA-binding beta-propeller fold protein YncE
MTKLRLAACSALVLIPALGLPAAAEPKPLPPASQIASLAFRPGGKLLAAGGYREVTLVDPADGTLIAKIGGLEGVATGVAFSPDGSRLAVAVSRPGVAGELRLYSAGASPAEWKPGPAGKVHKDSIHAVAFSPDGRTVATCSYDRTAKLVSAADGKTVHALTDHSDSVYGLAFSPDGRLLATVAADRAVKVWRTADGVRLYTLGECTDWVCAVAFSPDGKHLAAGGADKSLRVWAVDEHGGRLVRSAFAHEGAVAKVAYSPDGKTLYSLGEDRVLKAWDAAAEGTALRETHVFDRQPEAAPALAVSPDGKALALGRADGTATVYDAAAGKALSSPLPAKAAKPPAPALDRLAPSLLLAPAATAAPKTVEMVFEGKNLVREAEIVGLPAGVTAKVKSVAANGTKLTAELAFAAGTEPGVYRLSLKTPGGATEARTLALDAFPVDLSVDGADRRGEARALPLPATAAGGLDKAGDIDHYAFDAAAGAEIGVRLFPASPNPKLSPVVALLDPDGKTVAESSSDGSLGYVVTAAGRYVLRVRDAEYRGGPDYLYRVAVGPLPVVTHIFPLGATRGSTAQVRVHGVNLGGVRTVPVAIPADAKPGSRVDVPVMLPDGRTVKAPKLSVGEFPSVAPERAGDSPASAVAVPVPGTAEGRLAAPGRSDLWRFAARKGQRLILEIEAARLGSPLDSVIEVLDAAGKPVPRAVLRCLAKTTITLRDTDSAQTGIRLESAAELAVNDYVWINGELLRMRAAPPQPDADAQFFSMRGRRRGYLDTTPSAHPFGETIYKVALHPPGTVFPPNGMPVFAVNYRNDDGAATASRDSRLTFEAPADGDYLIRVSDARGEGGPAFAYRLTVREPRPDFTVSASPMNPAVRRGEALPVAVNIDRADDFDGPVEVRFLDVPAGFTLPPATDIGGLDNSTAVALSAASDAPVPAAAGKGGKPIRVVARAVIAGREVVREGSLGVPTLAEPGDLVTQAGADALTVVPGKSAWIKVNIERRNGFKGRVPVEVRGLPHGVKVLDIGLNGILITERETQRDIEIYAEPWAEPVTHPFVILAKREGKPDEHAAPSVTLRVAPVTPAPTGTAR